MDDNKKAPRLRGFSFDAEDLLLDLCSQFDSCLELRYFLSGDLDRLSGLRVATVTGSTLGNGKRTESDQ